MFSIEQNLAKKLHQHLEASHLKKITYLTNFYAPKSKRHAVLDRATLNFCTRVIHAHPEA